MPEAEITLNGWGRTTPALCQARRPERDSEARADFAAARANGLCLRGAGRSYGDCAVNPGGHALITTRLDRILDFDAESGIVQVEPGVDFARLLAVFLPRGYLAPVTPGTGYATIGGAVANDVHGKNHEHAGSFGQHVTELDVVLPDGTPCTITPADDALFRATCGGLGLTGMITRIAFRLQRVPGGCVSLRESRVADLSAFIAAMEDARDAPYTVGWIDGTARGAALGRGIMQTAAIAPGSHTQSPPRRRTVPVDFPATALNPWSVSLFMPPIFAAFPRQGACGPSSLPLSLSAGRDRQLEPHLWNARLLPISMRGAVRQWRGSVAHIARHDCQFTRGLVSRRAQAHGAGRAGYLSFPMEGYTLALDFANGQGVEALYSRLCAITRDAGGRVYLGKDALLSAEDFARCIRSSARSGTCWRRSIQRGECSPGWLGG